MSGAACRVRGVALILWGVNAAEAHHHHHVDGFLGQRSLETHKQRRRSLVSLTDLDGSWQRRSQ